MLMGTWLPSCEEVTHPFFTYPLRGCSSNNKLLFLFSKNGVRVSKKEEEKNEERAVGGMIGDKPEAIVACRRRRRCCALFRPPPRSPHSFACRCLHPRYVRRQTRLNQALLAVHSMSPRRLTISPRRPTTSPALAPPMVHTSDTVMLIIYTPSHPVKNPQGR
jgi:hypothetical protein